MLFFIFSGKDWESYEELIEDAAQGPHVDGGRVPDTHHDLGGTVKSALDVGVKLVLLISTRSEVNNLDSAFVALPEKDILWFHITMNDVIFFHIVE